MENKNERLENVEAVMGKAVELARLFNKQEDCPGVYFTTSTQTAPVIAYTFPASYVWAHGLSSLPEMAEFAYPKEITENQLPFIYQNPQEAESLVKVIIDNDLHDVALEIGVARGGFHMLLRSLFNRVISIELNPLYIINLLSRFRTLDERSTFVCGDSHDKTTMNLITRICSKIDMLFIDGKHTYQSVKSDYLMYSQFVRPGGIVVFHDSSSTTTHPDVKRFISDLENGAINGISHEITLFDDGANVGTSYEVISVQRKAYDFKAEHEEKRIKARFKVLIYRVLLKVGGWMFKIGMKLLKRLQ